MDKRISEMMDLVAEMALLAGAPTERVRGCRLRENAENAGLNSTCFEADIYKELDALYIYIKDLIDLISFKDLKDLKDLKDKRIYSATFLKNSDVHEIVAYLNVKAKKNFRPKSAATRRLIEARAKEGYTLDDFKQVIDNKVAVWGGDPKWDQFIRPETLFRPSHFESYLNESKPISAEAPKAPVLEDGQPVAWYTSRYDKH